MGHSPSQTNGFAGVKGASWWRNAHLALPLLFILFMFLYYPFRETFEFNYDEGGNVMKALLVARGYPLYSQVWSDQPPLLTYLLAVCIRLFGTDVNAARVVMLLFSTVLMAAAADFLRTGWGGWHALAGFLLIFLLPFYNRLSVSIMIGLPAIAFALLSLLALSYWHLRRDSIWLWLSALALSLSVSTKLFTGFLAPIFALGILLDERSRLGGSASWRAWLRPALLWSMIFATLVFAAAMLFVGPANLSQLFTSHLEARQAQDFISLNESEPLSLHMRDARLILLLAGIGCLFVLLERRWLSLYLIAWFLTGYFLLMVQIPVFFHHTLLVTVPAAILAGIAVGEAILWVHLVPRLFRLRGLLSWRTLLSVLALIIFIANVIERAPETLLSFNRRPAWMTQAETKVWSQQEQLFLTKMANHAAETHWVVTNLPMYAFRVNLIAPPYLSFVTAKRLSTGELTEENIIAVIQKYRPEQVLIGRHEFSKVKEYLQEDYRLIYERSKRFLYFRKDLKDQ